MRVAQFIACALSAAVAVSSAQAQAAGKSKPVTPASSLRYVVAPTGNEARYRVREQLAGFDLPKDAIGATKDITGRILIGADGKVVKDSSRITVQLSELKSDQTRRDNFLRRSTLETNKYPKAE